MRLWLLLAVGSMSLRVVAQEYVVVDIGAFAGAKAGYAIDINEKGDVTGNSGGTPYIWSQSSGLIPLPLPAGATYAFPNAINNQRTVVGESSEGPARWLHAGVPTILAHSNPWDPTAHGVNNLDQTVGKDTFAALWQPDGSIVQLGKLHQSDSFARAYDVNDFTQVVGVSGWQQSYAFIWENGVMRDLGGLPNNSGASAFAINEHGDVTGWNRLGSSGGPFRAVVYMRNGGPIINLGVLDPKLHVHSMATDINNALEVVGRSFTPSAFEAFSIWDPENGLRDLRPLLYSSPIWIRDPEGINDAGQIVGTGNLNSQSRPYLLNPVLRPLTFNILTGRIAGGNTIAAFTRSEDFKMVLQPGPVFSSSQPPISFEITGIAPPGGVTNLGIEVESSSSSPSIRQVISAFNYSLEEFQIVGSATLTTSDTTRNYAVGNSAAFIGPNQAVRLKVEYFPNGPVFAYPWSVAIDRLRWIR